MTATAENPTRTLSYQDRVEAVAPVIRRNIAFSDQERRLSPEVVDAFHDCGLFRLMVPVKYGGDGLTETDIGPVVEAVSRIDGAAGWNLAIGMGVFGFARMLGEEGLAEVFADPRGLPAGTLNPATVRVKQADGGYVVSGTAGFGSGCSQATWILGAGMLFGDSGPVMLPDGTPSIYGAFMPRDRVGIRETWDTTGLRGTGSHDLDFDDVFVPAHLVFDARAVEPNPVDPYWGVPLISRGAAALNAVGLGVVAHALDELRALAVKKPAFGSPMMVRDRADVQMAVAQASGLLEAARSVVETVPREVYSAVAAGGPATPDLLARLRNSYVTSTELLVQAVDRVNVAAGTSSLASDSVIGRCWRDAHAVASHQALQTRHHTNIGRVMLGLPPMGPL